MNAYFSSQRFMSIMMHKACDGKQLMQSHAMP